MPIERVKCRAKITVGGLTAETPYIQSFNVRKQRGQISTFDASMKIPAGVGGADDIAAGDVIIWAGRDVAEKKIFTGICLNAKISPCFDDPAYVMLSISGADKLILLQGKKFTRRVIKRETAWCAITGVVRRGLRSGKFAYDNESVVEITDGDLEKENRTTASRNENAVNSTNPTTMTNNNEQDIVVPTVEVYNEDKGQAPAQ